MINTNELVRLAQAYNFAANRHVDQRRKGSAAEPYINHLTEVAELVAQANDGKDLDLVIAAVLHDTVEDTKTSAAELETLFGSDVANLVAELTDDKSLAKEVRKELQIVHAKHASQRAQMIKMADKISNLRSLVRSPPAEWSQKRISEYSIWAARVVEGCRDAHAGLAASFDAALMDLSRVA
jgi:guanosine-3',5'-bis(diphosphate) 3'-pyrophosphohydrolase